VLLTIFTRTREISLSTGNRTPKPHWRSQNFWQGGTQIRKIFVTLCLWRFSV